MGQGEVLHIVEKYAPEKSKVIDIKQVIDFYRQEFNVNMGAQSITNAIRRLIKHQFVEYEKIRCKYGYKNIYWLKK